MEKYNQFFTIQELSKKLAVPKSTLRFWEKEFGGFIVPERTPGGQRRYTSANLYAFEKVLTLKKQGYTLVEIKTKLMNWKSEEVTVPKKININLLADNIAEVVKKEIFSFFSNIQ